MILALSLISVVALASDSHLCAYWIKALDDITNLEKMKRAVIDYPSGHYHWDEEQLNFFTSSIQTIQKNLTNDTYEPVDLDE